MSWPRPGAGLGVLVDGLDHLAASMSRAQFLLWEDSMVMCVWCWMGPARVGCGVSMRYFVWRKPLQQNCPRVVGMSCLDVGTTAVRLLMGGFDDDGC